MLPLPCCFYADYFRHFDAAITFIIADIDADAAAIAFDAIDIFFMLADAMP